MTKEFNKNLLWTLATLAAVCWPAACASTEQVLYSFTGAEGAFPKGGLVADSSTNLYGTASQGGSLNCGTVFELKRITGGYKEVTPWVFNYNPEASQFDGCNPFGTLIWDGSGNLYGTTAGGGTLAGGTVFELSPAAHGWTETILWNFGAAGDGRLPVAGLAMDASGNLYGTTSAGGVNNDGAVFELSPGAGSWSETVLYSFGAVAGDGRSPEAPVVLDSAGNVYGTTTYGGGSSACNSGCGTVFELVQASAWAEVIAASFHDRNGGANPHSGVILNTSGHLIGTALHGGLEQNGLVFETTDTPVGWRTVVLSEFHGPPNGGSHPKASLVASNGDYFGTTLDGGAMNGGTLVQFSKNSGGTWREKLLWSFGGSGDGKRPAGEVLPMGTAFFGTTSRGGANDMGAVYMVTP